MTSFSELFTNVKNTIKRVEGATALNVTRRALTFGSRDSWCGWRAVTWTTSAIEMVILTRGTSYAYLMPGFYPRLDAVAFTGTAVVAGDQILDAASDYWSIQTVQPVKVGSTVVCYACDLTYLSVYQADFAATTWTLTRGSDARYRTKLWLDAYARVAQITKDNDSTQASWATIFNEPPYTLKNEFRAASSPVQGLYVVDESNSTALVNHDLLTYGYLEHVPVHVCTVNSTACNGEALLWKMIAELRYVAETYPTGSLRLMESERKQDHDLGGMWLYDRVFTLEYERDKTA